jgi:hypothetical protein
MILYKKDRKVTAPDLRKDRQMALCRELLKPKYPVYGFKTADLKLALNEFFSRFSKTKLRLQIVNLMGVGYSSALSVTCRVGM